MRYSVPRKGNTLLGKCFMDTKLTNNEFFFKNKRLKTYWSLKNSLMWMFVLWKRVHTVQLHLLIFYQRFSTPSMICHCVNIRICMFGWLVWTKKSKRNWRHVYKPVLLLGLMLWLATKKMLTYLWTPMHQLLQRISQVSFKTLSRF